MKQVAKALSIASCIAIGAFGAGYKIPEQSLSSVAMSSATIAAVDGADASYYNPANMSLLPSGQMLEVGMTYIKLPKVKYSSSIAGTSGESKNEEFFVPALHYIGPRFDDFRFGLSIVAPGGLSKRWDTTYQKSSAQEFTLKIVEVNPTISYKLNEKLAVGFGVRGVYTEGIVKSSAAVSRDMSGDSIDYGYNMALTYRPTSELSIAATYRSKVDLSIEGDAKLYSGSTLAYDGDVKVTIPLPATFDIAASYTLDKTTLEFVYERTYWSAYRDLDFDYSMAIGGLSPYFDAPKAKNWKDSDTYRVGIKHRLNDKINLMAGFAIDKTPVPDDTIGFELPDSNAKVYSCGMTYKLNDKTTIGMAYLYSDREDRQISNSTMNGSISGSDAHLLRLSIMTRF